MPQISVIVPVYNVEKYLERCIESILKQTFTDFELILIDDGSPDRCGEICDGYAAQDPRIYVIHQKNGGLSAARNAGIDHAFAGSDSEWITFVDSDDWIHPDYLEQLILAAEQTSSDVSVCRHKKVYSFVPFDKETPHKTGIITPEKLFVSDHEVFVVAWGKLYKKSLFESVRYPRGKLHEDEFVTYRLLFNCKQLAYTDSYLYYYFQNSNGIILNKDFDTRKMDAIDALWEQCTFFHAGKYKEAERFSAELLFEVAAYVLSMSIKQVPADYKRINNSRKILRKAILRYGIKTDLGSKPYKRTCYKLAYPEITKLKNKWKHALILFRRIIYG